jgi:hypothetical protein
VTSFEGYDDPQDYTGTGGQHARRDIEADLRELIELIVNAKQMPLSNSALIPRDDVLSLLEQALRNIPDEIREARWALRDREELMAAEVHKAQQLMDQVRAEAARMVDKTEVVRQSRLAAEQIVSDAQSKARQLINQSEDFIDGKLANFEIVLERLLRTTHSGRERLSAQGLPTSMIEPAPAPDQDSAMPMGPLNGPGYESANTYDESSFFDQDAY